MPSDRSVSTGEAMEQRGTDLHPGNSENVRGVHRQVVLPFGKSLEIALQSIRVRFFRSLITTTSLVLAVSFLSFARVSHNAARSLWDSGTPELREALARAGYDLGGTGGHSGGMDAKQRWIVILSLLVCGVGIVNAQLMAVTERFREIGTMKCLGALDRFILRLFLLEAGIQGLAGALVGAFGGALAALAAIALRLGWSALPALSGSGVLQGISESTLMGFGLSLLGVLYPAWIASRMQPVEAMRAEH